MTWLLALLLMFVGPALATEPSSRTVVELRFAPGTEAAALETRVKGALALLDIPGLAPGNIRSERALAEEEIAPSTRKGQLRARLARQLGEQLDDVLYRGAELLEGDELETLQGASRRLRGQRVDGEVGGVARHLLVFTPLEGGRSLRIDHIRPGEARVLSTSEVVALDVDQAGLVAALARLMPEYDRPPAIELSFRQDTRWTRRDGSIVEGEVIQLLAGQSVVFDATGTTDPEQGTRGLTFRWEVDGAVVSTEDEGRLEWTFESTEVPVEREVRVIVQAGTSSAEQTAHVRVDPVVTLTDRTRALFLIGTSFVPSYTPHVILWVEPSEQRPEPRYLWRRIRGPPLHCQVVDPAQLVRCADNQGLYVETRQPLLFLEIKRSGAYDFEVVELADGIPSAPVEARTVGVYTRASLRRGVDTRFNAHIGVVGRTGELDLGFDLSPRWSMGLRFGLAAVIGYDLETARPHAAGLRPSISAELMNLISAGFDDPARTWAPSWRSSLARPAMFDWHLGFATPWLAAAGEPQDVGHGFDPCAFEFLTGPVVERGSLSVRVLSGVHRSLGAERGPCEAEPGPLEIPVKLGLTIQDRFGKLPSQAQMGEVYDAFELFRERRSELYACPPVPPAQLGEEVAATIQVWQERYPQRFDWNEHWMRICESSGTWLRSEVRPSQERRKLDRPAEVVAYFDRTDGGTTIALKLGGLRHERARAYDWGNALEITIQRILGDDCAVDVRIGDQPPSIGSIIGPIDGSFQLDLVRHVESLTVEPGADCSLEPGADAAGFEARLHLYELDLMRGAVQIVVLELAVPPPEEGEVRPFAEHLLAWSLEPHRVLGLLYPRLPMTRPLVRPPVLPLEER